MAEYRVIPKVVPTPVAKPVPAAVPAAPNRQHFKRYTIMKKLKLS